MSLALELRAGAAERAWEKEPGSPACTAAQPPAELSHMLSVSHRQCGLLQRKEVSVSFALFLHMDKGLMACRDLPQLQGAASASFFFAFLSFSFPGSGESCQHLTGFLGVQSCVAAAESSLVRIPGGMKGGMEPSSSAQLCCLGHHGACRAVSAPDRRASSQAACQAWQDFRQERNSSGLLW